MTMKTIKQLTNKYYPYSGRPNSVLESMITGYMSQHSIILDAGCGYDAYMISRFSGKAGKLIGADKIVMPKEAMRPGIDFIQCDLSDIPLKTESVDLVISRNVLEHIKDVGSVYDEISRVLKTGGHFIFLVPNLFDYASILSLIIPNRLHKRILLKIDPSRNDKDTFDVYYRSNTARSIRRLAQKAGFNIISIDYLSHYPYALVFNSLIFRVGIIYDMMLSRIRPMKFLKGCILAVLEKSG